jgi:hypothetical protein
MYNIISSTFGYLPQEFSILYVFFTLLAFYGITRIIMAPLEQLILLIRSKIRGR